MTNGTEKEDGGPENIDPLPLPSIKSSSVSEIINDTRLEMSDPMLETEVLARLFKDRDLYHTGERFIEDSRVHTHASLYNNIAFKWTKGWPSGPRFRIEQEDKLDTNIGEYYKQKSGGTDYKEPHQSFWIGRSALFYSKTWREFFRDVDTAMIEAGFSPGTDMTELKAKDHKEKFIRAYRLLICKGYNFNEIAS